MNVNLVFGNTDYDDHETQCRYGETEVLPWDTVSEGGIVRNGLIWNHPVKNTLYVIISVHVFSAELIELYIRPFSRIRISEK